MLCAVSQGCTYNNQFTSVAQSRPTHWPHGLQHARPPCPSPTPGTCSNSCPSSWWCHPTISSSVIPFFSCPQSFPASGSFPISQFFAPSGQSIGASASVLPMNIQGWFPFGLTGLISLQSKGLSRVFSNTTFQKHQFFGAKLSFVSLGKFITRYFILFVALMNGINSLISLSDFSLFIGIDFVSCDFAKFTD